MIMTAKVMVENVWLILRTHHDFEIFLRQVEGDSQSAGATAGQPAGRGATHTVTAAGLPVTADAA